MPKVMCTSLNAEAGPHFDAFDESGFLCEVVSREANLFDADELLAALGDCEGILAGSEFYPREVLEAIPSLRVISRTGVGYDAIDLEAADELGIVVATTPGVNHHAVAEHAIALLMGVSRGFPDADRQVREHRWRRVARPRVMGRTLGLVGLGRIGKAVAARAKGLGMQVVAFEPHPDRAFVDEHGVELVELDDLLARSDYVSLHCPASAENHHLMNAATFAKMKPGGVLINTSRGRLVDEAALCDALDSGQLRAAGLDVFEVEPLPETSPLLEQEGVLFSGHVAGLDVESHDDTFAMAADTVVQLHRGDWPAERIVNMQGRTAWNWEGSSSRNAPGIPRSAE